MLSLKAGMNPAYDYFFFLGVLEFKTKVGFFDSFFFGTPTPNEIVVTDDGRPIAIHSLALTFLNAMFSPLALSLMSQQVEYLNQDNHFISPILPNVKCGK